MRHGVLFGGHLKQVVRHLSQFAITILFQVPTLEGLNILHISTFTKRRHRNMSQNRTNYVNKHNLSATCNCLLSTYVLPYPS